jgi:hypothetical protein
VSAERLPFDESFLKEKLKNDPTTWETRRELAHGLFNKQAYAEAAEIIWNADQIPSTDLDLAFAVRILAKAQPRRAIRLLTAILELNVGKAVQNMAMANALLHHGMVLQAARFYGAALDADPSLANSDLEHFILWSDDECTMWDLFEKHRPKLGELPWMIRDPKEALRLTSRVSLHTTPIYVPDLPAVAGEKIKHELYQQEPAHNAKITPPPAVTIPIDRVDPKDRLFDATYGASVVNSTPAETAAPADAVQPIVEPVAPTPVVPVASFPARVVFPESPTPAAPITPVVPVLTPISIPTPIAIPVAAPEPVAVVPEPVEVVPEPVAVVPEPVAVVPEPVAVPVATPEPIAAFFADPTPSSSVAAALEPVVVAPESVIAPQSIAAFFADPTPSSSVKESALASFFADPTPSSQIQLPPIDPEKAKEKTPILDALPISQSSVPTTLLRVKWSTAPARPGDAPAAVPAPRPVPAPMPVAQPVPVTPPAAPLPMAPAASMSPPEPPQVSSVVDFPTPIGAPTGTPTAVFAAAGPAPIPTGTPVPVGTPISAANGAPTRALLPSGTPPASPTGVPTRALLPSGTPPANLTGAPTRALLPSGAPPENAAAPRRLLFTPKPQNPAS